MYEPVAWGPTVQIERSTRLTVIEKRDSHIHSVTVRLARGYQGLDELESLLPTILTLQLLDEASRLSVCW